jgi:hypothetical protein
VIRIGCGEQARPGIETAGVESAVVAGAVAALVVRARDWRKLGE